MKGPYDDIIDLPYPYRSNRKKMSAMDRAAQFSPFAALTGYDNVIYETGRLTDEKIELGEGESEILNRKYSILLENIAECPSVSVTYFVPDDKKDGGSYVTAAGALRRIDEVAREMQFTDGTKILMADIADIECDLFPGMADWIK